jgi:molecular chaperone GrpE (heat shock protein)
MNWCTRLLALLRGPRSASLQAIRELAVDVSVSAANLAGQDTPAELGDLTTAEVLQATSHSLQLARARIQQLTQQAESHPQADPHPPDIAADLIEILDQLALQPDDPARRWLESRLSRVAGKCEICRIDDSGSVDHTRHEVVGVQRATGAERPGDIAARIRPGYSWRGRILRAEQVVAFRGDESP